MMRKTFQGLGWLSAVFCVGVAGAANSYDTTPFLGMWTTRAESIHSTCDSPAVDDVLGTSITWSAGSASGHIQAELIGKCVLDAKINGKTATASDQTCTDNGLTYVVGGTFILQPDGTGRLNEHIHVTGRGVNCTGTVNGPFLKQ